MNDKHELGDEPIQDEYRALMNDLMRAMDKGFNGQVGGKGRKTGIVLLIFPFGETGGRCNYISNGANREDVEKLLFEQAQRFKEDREKGVTHTPTA